MPGPAARLLFEMSPVGGTLAWFRCSGLNAYWFERANVLFPSVKVLFFTQGNLHAWSWTRPCESPGKTLPWLLSALRTQSKHECGPKASWGLARPSSPTCELSTPPSGTQIGMYQLLSSG